MWVKALGVKDADEIKNHRYNPLNLRVMTIENYSMQKRFMGSLGYSVFHCVMNRRVGMFMNPIFLTFFFCPEFYSVFRK